MKLFSFRSAIVVLGLLTIAGIAQNAWYWPQLPLRVATHFGVQGQPNGWMTRSNAVLVMCLFQFGMPLFLLSIAPLLKRTPPSLINLPHKDYWLHPDRIGETREVLRRWFAWLAVLFAGFAMALNHLTFIANRDQAPLDMTVFPILFVTFLTGALVLIGGLLLRFRRPDHPDQVSL